jgi:putative transposase
MLDQTTAEFKTPQELQSAYSQMLQHMINRALEDELQARLGHECHGRSSGNTRNGKIPKTLLSTDGALEVETPRVRDGTFEPQLVKKRQVRLFGMEEKILALYACGMTTRDIESALMDLWGDDLTRADRASDGCGVGRGTGVADATAGVDLPDRVVGTGSW